MTDEVPAGGMTGLPPWASTDRDEVAPLGPADRDTAPSDPAAAAAAEQARPPRTRARARYGLVVIVVVLAALALGAVAGLQVYVHGRVPFGVKAAGRSLGGQSAATAAGHVRALVAARHLDSAVLATRNGPVTLPLARLGLAIDPQATARRAVGLGRLSVLGLPIWYGRGGGVEPVVRLDPAAFQAGLEKIAAAVETPARDATLVVHADGVSVRPAAPGQAIDQVALRARIAAALAAWREPRVDVPLQPSQPTVTTADAQAAAEQASVYVSSEVRLRYRSHEIVLTPTDLAPMLSVNHGAEADTYPLTFDNAVSRAVLHRLFAFAETPAVSARVRVRGKTIFVTRSKEGFGLDMPRLLADLDDVASRAGLREVVVPLTVLRPKVTTDELQALGLSGLGTEFTTYYDPGNAARAQNIEQAAQLANGALIKPGQTFSLNGRLGPRTINRGFDYAPVIQNGVLQLGVGGGICQFATTLFNTAFFAGLPIVERHPHDFFIDHYPIGRDAQVAYGSQDLRFTNDTRRALLLRCWASDGQLTVVLVGDTGRTVTYTTSRFYDVRPSGTSRSHPRVFYDGTIAKGVITLEKGYPGETVRVIRTVRHAGKVIARDTFVSTYAAKDWIKRVGTR